MTKFTLESLKPHLVKNLINIKAKKSYKNDFFS